MMKALRIDFGVSRHGSPWLGAALLALAAAVAVDAGISYHAAKQAVRENETRVARRAPAASAAKATPQEVAAARETVQRLAMPWDHLFRALEAAASDRVVLASIEPDTRNGTVTIAGDGNDYLAALSYVANLSHIDGLERVQMVRHEQKANQNGAVSFAVSAAWSTK